MVKLFFYYPMTFKEFVKEMNNGEVEGELVKVIVISLTVSFVTLLALYLFKFRYIDDFMIKYGFYLFFAAIAYAFILPSVHYVRSFKDFPCMSGMMIGMTIGMIAGFLPGLYIGATNGMFYGSVFGMAIGIYLGIWNGKCCGIMGVMEGMMAGFMGGLMGAMTAVMMINDNLKLAVIIVSMISLVIVFSLNYMIYNETRGASRKHKDDVLFVPILTFILIIATVILMVFGPRSVLFG